MTSAKTTRPVRAKAPPPDAPPAADTAGLLSDNDMYERMVSAILEHRLPPGTKLVEDRLAAAFGVSRTRVRPVLVRLANEQVVTLTPRRGASIAQPTPQEAREVFEARRLLEPRLVELFIANAAAADIATLRACIDDEEAACASGDMRRAIRLSGDFHLRIAQVAGQQTLGRILRELVSRTSLILMTYSPGQARERERATACGCREHRALVDAIRLRDAREAARLMLAHLARIAAQLDFTPPAAQAPDLVRLLGGSA
ncbi:GntR family transcriptional regulator [Verminephrobacter eiseniae]|uniref:GntR family transcriptional regulator n=1 Tax=Verminephrobacter eiseniae TaxID=364317 RepID=UPI00223834DD|nr:GntR family transcriptional regulator [Verminephrobacter eiseniae]MCW5237255.1 GntR family transcriptional regulator [Verminephrobacter eiseniae]